MMQCEDTKAIVRLPNGYTNSFDIARLSFASRYIDTIYIQNQSINNEH